MSMTEYDKKVMIYHLEKLLSDFEYHELDAKLVLEDCSISGGEYYRGKAWAYKICAEEIKSLLNDMKNWK